MVALYSDACTRHVAAASDVQDDHYSFPVDEAVYIPKRSWPEHYLYLVAVSDALGGADAQVLANIVHYASSELHTVLMAKYDGKRVDYLVQVEDLAHFAQYVELNTRNAASFGKDVVTRC
ncbi:unnamed protein product [Peronospora effusa]|nr:unnamed protein product [Peronospora effusa]